MISPAATDCDMPIPAQAAMIVPNAPLTWGAIYRNGLVYVPDMNSGLWVVKVDGSAVGVP